MKRIPANILLVLSLPVVLIAATLSFVWTMIAVGWTAGDDLAERVIFSSNPTRP